MPESTTELVMFRSPTARIWILVMGFLACRAEVGSVDSVAASVASVVATADTG